MIDASAVAEVARRTVSDWIEARRNTDGTVNPGLLATALAVLERMSKVFPLTSEAVATDSQVRGQGGPAIARILSRYGETRRFLSEGGRTSRGSREAGIALGAELTTACEAAMFLSLSSEDRAEVVSRAQRWLVEQLGPEYFDRERITADLLDPRRPVRFAIASIFDAASARGGNAAGAVAQHLVGAKLELRFPSESIGRDNYTTADQQTVRAGDFQVGDSAIHVTMSPSQQLMSSRCAKNIADGFRPIVLVPESKVAAAKQLAELANLQTLVDVLALESFIGSNVEEMAQFSSAEVKSGLRALLDVYNSRVLEIESNQSLLIEIPANL